MLRQYCSVKHQFFITLTKLQEWIGSACQGNHRAVEASRELPADVLEEAEGHGGGEPAGTHRHVGYALGRQEAVVRKSYGQGIL